MRSRIFSPDKSAVPAPVIAARRKAAVDASGALSVVFAKAATEQKNLDAEQAALAEAAPLTTDDATIDARLRRREHLTMKAEGHRALPRHDRGKRPRR